MQRALILALVAVLILLWIYTTQKEHLKNEVPALLQPYLGYWLYNSDDGLRKEVISIDYGGNNAFLRFTRNYTIRKWFPPVLANDDP